MKRAIAILCLAGLVMAGVDLEQAETIAEAHISVKGQDYSIFSHTEMENLFVFNLAPLGYVIVTRNQALPPVLAYSFDSDLSPDGPMLDIAQRDILERLDVLPETDENIVSKNNKLWRDYLSGKAALDFLDVYGPFIDTEWNQSEPFWDYCPIDPVTDERCYVGCVAVAVGQVLNYYEWPPRLILDEFDNYRNGRVDFPVSAVGLSLDTIDYNEEGTDMSVETRARFLRALGQALNMAYGSSGSGAWSMDFDFLNEFAFGSVMSVERGDTLFVEKMIGSIIEGDPAILDMWEGLGGHEVVVDGYNSSDGSLHFNMGWGGADDGWYNLEDGLPGGFATLQYANYSLSLPEYNTHLVPGDFPTIQAGVDAALSGDTIYLAATTYTGDGNRDIDFMGKAITIIGAGVDSTIIDLEGTESDPHRAFIVDEQEMLHVKDLTVRNGYHTEGGAVYAHRSEPVFENVRFENCHAQRGGVLWGDIANPFFINAEMTGNSAEMGGVLYLASDLVNATVEIAYAILFGKKSRPVFINSTVSNNEASQYGGAFFFERNTDMFAMNSIFYANSAAEKGDICFTAGEDGNVYLESCVLQGGEAYKTVLHPRNTYTADEEVTAGEYSPIHNSGVTEQRVPFFVETILSAPLTDIYGQPRGERPDIGAIEYEITPSNRPPSIAMTSFRAGVGDTSLLCLFAFDPDGDTLSISCSYPVRGDTIIFFEEMAGEYNITITLADGTDHIEKEISIIADNSIGGIISGILDDDGSPYTVSEDIYVFQGDTLVIDGGVTLLMEPETHIYVLNGGVLKVEGDSDSPGIITAVDTSLGYGGIAVIGRSSVCRIDNAIIEYGKPQYMGMEKNGGGIFVETSEHTSISNTEIRHCSAKSGGGVFISEDAEVSIENTIFTLNRAEENGGGLYMKKSLMEISNTDFVSNRAGKGGGLYVWHNMNRETAEFSGLSLTGNDAMNACGVYIYYATIHFIDLAVTENFSESGSVIQGDSCSIAFSDFSITGNEADVLMDFEDGYFAQTLGSIISNDLNRVILMDNALYAADKIDIRDNNAQVFDMRGVEASFENSIISDNDGIFDLHNSTVTMCNLTCLDDDMLLDMEDSKVAILNTVFWDGHISAEDCSLYVSHSIIPDTEFEGYFEGENVSAEDPMLGWEMYPLEGSPVIDEGNNVFTTYLGSVVAPNLDIYGNRRPRGSFRWDIGAVESEMSYVLEKKPEQIELTAYPNPFNSAVEINGAYDEHVSIVDRKGRIVDQGNLPFLWKPENLPSGTYIARTQSGEENLIYIK